MEERFGHDFADVRIHTDVRAARSAEVVGAQAYAVGSDIVFGVGRYSPGTLSGDRLLAHELAHVVQSPSPRSSSSDLIEISKPGDSDERDAVAASTAAIAGDKPPALPPRVRRLRRSIGSPAGGCGICYGTPAAAGIAAHSIIQLEFEAMHPMLFTEFPLLPAPGDDNGRLDLALPTPLGLLIGEIKPANPAGLLQGDIDLFWYENQLRLFHLPVAGRLTLPPPPPPIVFPNPGLPGSCYQELTILPPVHGIYMYYCEPDFAVLRASPACQCKPRVPVPVPVRVPARVPARRRVPVPGLVPSLGPSPIPDRRVLEAIRDFIREVVRTGEDAEQAARRFLRAHPEVLEYLAYAMIGVAVVVVVATIIEDILTLGAGLLDDPASFAAAAALVRAAMEILQRGGPLPVPG